MQPNQVPPSHCLTPTLTACCQTKCVSTSSSRFLELPSRSSSQRVHLWVLLLSNGQWVIPVTRSSSQPYHSEGYRLWPLIRHPHAVLRPPSIGTSELAPHSNALALTGATLTSSLPSIPQMLYTEVNCHLTLEVPPTSRSIGLPKTSHAQLT